MQPATKRRRTKETAPADAEEDDELFLQPDEVNQNRDPVVCLERKRAYATYKLKSRYEDIFAKYGKDFTGIGDEIDLVSGEVVVDNGHLKAMTSATDTGWGEDGEDDSEGDQGEDAAHERPPAELAEATGPPVLKESLFRTPSATIGGSARLPMSFSGQRSFTALDRSFSPFGLGSFMSSDPAWETPDVPESAFLRNSLGSNGPSSHRGSFSATRKISRKLWAGNKDVDADDEDALAQDVLSGVTGNALKSKTNDVLLEKTSAIDAGTASKPKEKESPVLKLKFPAFSSPQEDTSQKDLVNDLIQNMPPTPPSIQKPGAAKRRGRPSKLKHAHTIGSDVTATGSLQETRDSDASWHDNDLVSFVDITGRTSVKPAGQLLYVHIEKKQTTETASTVIDDHNLVGAETRAIKGTSAIVTGCSNCPPVENSLRPMRTINPVGRPKGSKKASKNETFSRNFLDPTFDFSDEDILLPKRPRKIIQISGADSSGQMTAQTTGVGVSVPTDGPNSYDDTPLEAPSPGSPSLAVSTNEDDNLFDPAGDTLPPLKDKPTQPVPQKDYGIEPRSRRPKLNGPSTARPNPPHNLQTSSPLDTSKPLSLRSRRRRDPSLELGEPPLVTEIITVKAGVKRPEPPEQLKTPPPAPFTPNTKYQGNGDASLSIISLVSEEEDDEDEISFDHSDFTPSGHHRIILEKPFLHLRAPLFSTSHSSSTKKNKRADLSLGSKSASASSQHGKTRTPSEGNSTKPVVRSSKGRIRYGMDKKRRKSMSSRLAQSVVRVVPRRGDGQNAGSSLERSPAPVGEIVQTPGGTRRRCGKDGFRCDQDFCFVCS